MVVMSILLSSFQESSNFVIFGHHPLFWERKTHYYSSGYDHQRLPDSGSHGLFVFSSMMAFYALTIIVSERREEERDQTVSLIALITNDERKKKDGSIDG